MDVHYWRWNVVLLLGLPFLSFGADVNPSCTSVSSSCPVLGQSCVLSLIQNRRICACPGNEFAAGESCRNRCPAVDSSIYGSCSGGSALCTVPCNYPRGECDYSNGKCACSEGHLGTNCTAQCPGFPNSCSGNGACVLEKNQIASCVCDSGFRGADCSTECPGGASNPCNNNGECNAQGQCVCQAAWRGDDCSLNCAGSSVAICSGNGICQDDASCQCEWGYGGLGCEFKCPFFSGHSCGCSSPDDEGCRGTCGDQGKCSCRLGFAGDDCGMECPRANGIPCSGNGECSPQGVCNCTVAWTGPTCAVPCPGTAELPCSGHGRCKLTTWTSSMCVCETGLPGFIERYTGDACEFAVYNEMSRIEGEEQDMSGGSWWPAVVLQLPFWIIFSFLALKLWRMNKVVDEGLSQSQSEESDSKSSTGKTPRTDRRESSPRHRKKKHTVVAPILSLPSNGSDPPSSGSSGEEDGGQPKSGVLKIHRRKLADPEQPSSGGGLVSHHRTLPDPDAPEHDSTTSPFKGHHHHHHHHHHHGHHKSHHHHHHHHHRDDKSQDHRWLPGDDSRDDLPDAVAATKAETSDKSTRTPLPDSEVRDSEAGAKGDVEPAHELTDVEQAELLASPLR